MSTVPDIDGDGVDDAAMCFDADLVDMHNQHIIGTATDCLSEVTAVGNGPHLVATTIFNFPHSQLVLRGNTTVQPVLAPTTTASGQTVTHITGAARTGNAIIGGTGAFVNSTGTSRLSGMVDMTTFGGNPGDIMVFDCIFVINLD